jgi:type 1 glutamine amidotransferase
MSIKHVVVGVFLSGLAIGVLGGAVERTAFDAALVKDCVPEQTAPLRVVLLADKKDHGPVGNGLHDYPLWQERWALLLGGRAADAVQINLHGPAIADAASEEGAPGVSIEHAAGWPTEGQFATADVIAAFCYLPWNDARKKQVGAYLARGGGLVVIHSATWTQPKADAAVAELLGVGGFTHYRHGAVNARVVAKEHPVCRNLPDELRWDDEVYWPPLFPAACEKVTVLAVSSENDKGTAAHRPQPVFWCYEIGRGRVFGCVLGHRTAMFDDPWFRLVVLRGIAWAAGGSPFRFDRLAPRGARFD